MLCTSHTASLLCDGETTAVCLTDNLCELNACVLKTHKHYTGSLPWGLQSLAPSAFLYLPMLRFIFIITNTAILPPYYASRLCITTMSTLNAENLSALSSSFLLVLFSLSLGPSYTASYASLNSIKHRQLHAGIEFRNM